MNLNQDPKQLLSAVIKKQIVILGPDITLAKARNVAGLVVADDGTVTDISGDPQQITQKLIDQFVQLSGEIVKKTMEPLLNASPATNPPNSQKQTQPPPTLPEVTSQPAVQTTPPSQEQTVATTPPADTLSNQQQVPVAEQALAEQAKPVQ